MTFFELTQPMIKRRALRELKQLIRRDGTVEGGLAPDTADLLQAGIRERGLDAMLPAVSVRVYVDPDALSEQQTQFQQHQEQLAQLRSFLRARASCSLIRALFPSIQAGEIERLRLQLGLQPPGAAVRLGLTEHEHVHQIWKELKSTTASVRERYLALHDAFPHHTLLTLFAALNQR